MKKRVLLSVFVLAIVVGIGGCPFLNVGNNPQLELSATPTVGNVPATITFEASISFAGKYRDPGAIPNFPPIGGLAPAPPCVWTSYTWNFGDGVVVTNTNSTVTHTYNTAGVYTVRVTANFVNCPSVSATTTVTILAGNTPPIANAGPDQTVPFVGDVNFVEVTLDGSASYDPAKVITQYIWTGVPDPEDVVQPTVQLTLGTYEFTLVVIDNDGLESEPDTVTITVALPPVADAGDDITVPLPAGQTTAAVQLDGTGSYDPNDLVGKTITQYIWTGTPDPEDVAQPTLNLPLGEYDFTLVVQSSNGLTSQTDTVHVSVVPPPVANAGEDRVVAFEGEGFVPVTLDGSLSYDPKDTPAKSIVQYRWTGDPDPDDVAQPTVLLGPGEYTFTLVVVDNYGFESAADTVTITVAWPPVANAGSDIFRLVEDEGDTVTVTLDGSGSFDPNDQSGTKSLVQYMWTGDPDPDDVMQPSVTLGPGTYTFTLVVRNHLGLSSEPDTVQVSVFLAGTLTR